MITQSQLRDVIGATVYDRDEDKIGEVGQVYYDDDTNEPKWITVAVGLFGIRETFVPLQGADLGGDRVTVDYDKATVKGAPRGDEADHLTADEEASLCRHYGLDPAGGHGAGNAAADLDTQPIDRSRPNTKDDRPQRCDDRTAADEPMPTTAEAMTHSGERLRVGTPTRSVGQPRPGMHVATDPQP